MIESRLDAYRRGDFASLLKWYRYDQEAALQAPRVTCKRPLYSSTRRRVSSATPRAVPRFLPELLLHSPLAEKGQ